MSDVIDRLVNRYPAGDGPFVFPGDKAWTFAYSNRNPIRTLAIAFVVAGVVDPVGEVELRRLNTARQVARGLADSCNASFGEIRFVSDGNGISEFLLDHVRLSDTKLRNWFAGCGLQVNQGSVAKPVNRGMASWFSEWQRVNLGGITVTDIDLVQTRVSDGAVEVIYELKRSHQPLDRWRPYRTDFPNFDVLSQVASAAGAKFRILYNHMGSAVGGQDRVDNASQVALFSYPLAGHRPDLMSFDEFVGRVTP